MEPNKGCAPAAKSAVPKTEDNCCKTETPLRSGKKVTRNNASELDVEMVEASFSSGGEMRTKPVDFRAESSEPDEASCARWRARRSDNVRGAECWPMSWRHWNPQGMVHPWPQTKTTRQEWCCCGAVVQSNENVALIGWPVADRNFFKPADGKILFGSKLFFAPGS